MGDVSGELRNYLGRYLPALHEGGSIQLYRAESPSSIRCIRRNSAGKNGLVATQQDSTEDLPANASLKPNFLGKLRSCIFGKGADEIIEVPYHRFRGTNGIVSVDYHVLDDSDSTLLHLHPDEWDRLYHPNERGVHKQKFSVRYESLIVNASRSSKDHFDFNRKYCWLLREYHKRHGFEGPPPEEISLDKHVRATFFETMTSDEKSLHDVPTIFHDSSYIGLDDVWDYTLFLQRFPRMYEHFSRNHIANAEMIKLQLLKGLLRQTADLCAIDEPYKGKIQHLADSFCAQEGSYGPRIDTPTLDYDYWHYPLGLNFHMKHSKPESTSSRRWAKPKLAKPKKKKLHTKKSEKKNKRTKRRK